MDASMFSIDMFSVGKWNEISNKVESEAKGDYSTSELCLSEILFSNLSYLLNVGSIIVVYLILLFKKLI